jgi:hypothetical protein
LGYEPGLESQDPLRKRGEAFFKSRRDLPDPRHGSDVPLGVHALAGHNDSCGVCLLRQDLLNCIEVAPAPWAWHHHERITKQRPKHGLNRFHVHGTNHGEFSAGGPHSGVLQQPPVIRQRSDRVGYPCTVRCGQSFFKHGEVDVASITDPSWESESKRRAVRGQRDRLRLQQRAFPLPSDRYRLAVKRQLLGVQTGNNNSAVIKLLFSAWLNLGHWNQSRLRAPAEQYSPCFNVIGNAKASPLKIHSISFT